MYVPVWVYKHHVPADAHGGRQNEGIRSPKTVVTVYCELLGGCWELNPASRHEQQKLLTTELSVHP